MEVVNIDDFSSTLDALLHFTCDRTGGALMLTDFQVRFVVYFFELMLARFSKPGLSQAVGQRTLSETP